MVASYYVLEVDPTNYILYDNGLDQHRDRSVQYHVGMYLQDLYSDIYVKSKITLMQQLCLVIGAVFLIQGLISYLNAEPQNAASHHGVRQRSSGPVDLLRGALLFGSFMSQVVGRDRLLLVGNSPLLDDLAGYLERHPEKGLDVTGLWWSPPIFLEPTAARVLGSMRSLKEIVAANQPDPCSSSACSSAATGCRSPTCWNCASAA